MSLIDFEERKATNVHFDLFLDVRKYGWDGVIKRQNERWKYIVKPCSKIGYGRKNIVEHEGKGQQLVLLGELEKDRYFIHHL